MTRAQCLSFPHATTTCAIPFFFVLLSGCQLWILTACFMLISPLFAAEFMLMTFRNKSNKNFGQRWRAFFGCAVHLYSARLHSTCVTHLIHASDRLQWALLEISALLESIKITTWSWSHHWMKEIVSCVHCGVWVVCTNIGNLWDRNPSTSHEMWVWVHALAWNFEFVATFKFESSCNCNVSCRNTKLTIHNRICVGRDIRLHLLAHICVAVCLCVVVACGAHRMSQCHLESSTISQHERDEKIPFPERTINPNVLWIGIFCGVLANLVGTWHTIQRSFTRCSSFALHFLGLGC